MGAVNYCVRCPIGVAGLISPWNLPLYLLTFKIAPAIAAGNTVVCKPSEMTSVTAWMMAKLMNEAGGHLIAFVFIGVLRSPLWTSTLSCEYKKK